MLLNTVEILITNLHAGVIWTDAGDVLPFGDERLGCRWVVRERARVQPSGRRGLLSALRPPLINQPLRGEPGQETAGPHDGRPKNGQCNHSHQRGCPGLMVMAASGPRMLRVQSAYNSPRPGSERE